MTVQDDGAWYLICKRGVFYRPDCQGYTSHKSQAGLFSLAEAIRTTHPNGLDGPRDGMTYVRYCDSGETIIRGKAQ